MKILPIAFSLFGLSLLTGCVQNRPQSVPLADDYLRPVEVVHPIEDVRPVAPLPPPDPVDLHSPSNPYAPRPKPVRQGPGPQMGPRMVEQVEPAAPVADTPAPLAFETILGAQIALDRAHFSSGAIDGKSGRKTAAALNAWRVAHGKSIDDRNLMNLLGTKGAAVKEVVVSAADLEGLTVIPKSWPERAKLQSMAHETALERIAERYHASEGLIRQLNPTATWPNPAVGTPLKVPAISRGRSLRADRLVVNQGNRTVTAYDAGGKLIAQFPCSIAASVANRPAGETTVKNQAADPNYTFDPKIFPEVPPDLRGDKRLVIPPGPNNPVGVAWVGLDLPGYGIHGTPKPERIGNAESHGCIRLTNWDALKLAHMVRAGVRVVFE